PPRLLRPNCSCRRLLELRPLAADDVARAVAAAIGGSPDAADITAASAVADGSVRRALALLDDDALDLRNRIMALLDGLPAVDPPPLPALHDPHHPTTPPPPAHLVSTP